MKAQAIAMRARAYRRMWRSFCCLCLAPFLGFFGAAPLALAQSTPPDPHFIAAPNIPLGFQPLGAALGDVNADNKLDLVVIGTNNNTGVQQAQVFLGNGDGTFQTAPKITPQTASFSPGLGSFSVFDVNGDGCADLVAEDGGGTAIHVFLSNCDGTFNTTNATSYPLPGYGGVPAPLYFADVNGDGYPDIITPALGSSPPSVNIFLNIGDGTFGTGQPVSLSSTGTIEKLAVGDFNGDGKPDLAVGVTTYGNPLSNAILVVLNNTAKDATTVSFPTATTISLTTTSGNANALAMTALGSGDFGNGHQDLFVVEPNRGASGLLYSGLVYFVEGNGDGTFNPEQSISSPFVTVTTGLVVADFNNDGKLDAAFTDGNDGITVMLNQGLSGGIPTFQTNHYVAGPGTYSPPASGVLTPDGYNDLVVPTGSGVSILLNNADGTFQASESYQVGAIPIGIAQFQNFGGQGENDLAVANTGAGTVSVLGASTPPNGVLNTLATIPAPAGDGSPSAVAAGCLKTATPCSSVIAAGYFIDNSHPSEVAIFLPGSTAPVSSISLPAAAEAISMAFADFNGDGNNDLAIVLCNGPASISTSATTPCHGSGDSAIEVFTGDGKGNFSSPLDIAVPGIAVGLIAKDFNADGKPDLVALMQTPANLAILFNNTAAGSSNVTFQNMVAYPITSAVSGDTPLPVSMAVGDFDQQGTADDIAVVSSSTFELDLFLNSGSGTFSPIASQRIFGLSGAITAGDFNGDGITDLAAVSTTSVGSLCAVQDSAIILLGSGNGNFQAANTSCGASNTTGFLYPAGNTPTALAAADFNGDGKPDLAITAGGSTAVTLILSGTPSQVGTGPSYANYAGSPALVPYGGEPSVSLSTNVNTVATEQVSLTNTGGVTIHVTGISISANYPYWSLTNVVCNGVTDFPFSSPVSLGPGQSCDLTVQFAPTAASSALNNVLTVLDDAAGSNAQPETGGQAILLQGTATAPYASFSATQLSFGSVNDGTAVTQTETITNTGNGPLAIQLIFFSLTGNNSNGNGFDYTQILCNGAAAQLPVTLATSQSCTVTVGFDPFTVGLLSSNLYFLDNAASGESNLASTQSGSFFAQALPLSGTGVADYLVTDTESISVTDTETLPDTAQMELIHLTDTAIVKAGLTSLFVVANNSTKVYGSANPSLTASIAGALSGDSFAASLFTTAANSSAVGQYPITVTGVTGTDGNSTADLVFYQIMEVNGALTVTQAGTSVALSTSASGPVADGAPVILTANVASSTTGIPTGTVTFLNGSSTLATATLSQGVATLTTSTLPTGTDSITAQYGGDSNFTGSTSAPETVSVNAPDYTVNASPTGLTLAAGQSGTTTITITPEGFTGSVSASCGNVPSYISCAFNPSSGSLTFDSGSTTPQTLTLTISVASSVGALSTNRTFIVAALMPLGLLGVVLIAGDSRRRWWSRASVAASVLLLVGLMTGCGSGSGSGTKLPPAGSQTVTVTASGSSSSGTISHQLQLTVSITN